MKKYLLLSISVFLSYLLCSASGTELVSLYEKGTIVCSPDPGFAQGMDWGSLFFDGRRQIQVAPDGSIFVSNQSDHTISRFSPDGILQKHFGRQGNGPGELEQPGSMSILDGRFLVVGDRHSNHRISLFRLDGTFHKMLKTRRPPSFPQALSQNKVAYIASISRPPVPADSMVYRYLRTVYIKDADSGEEIEVVKCTTSLNPVKDGTVILAKTGEGQLLVGMTLKPELDVYDVSGRKTKSISLDISPLKVNNTIKKNHQMNFVITRDGKPTDYKAPIGEYLPYYSDLHVDSEGNILVFLMTEDPEQGPFPFQVYSPEGKLICRTQLDTREYVFKPDPRFNKLDFTNHGVFFILYKKGDELETPRLAKIW